MLQGNEEKLAEAKAVLRDGGYTGKPFARGGDAAPGKEVEVKIAKRSELHEFKVISKRWVVERSFAWLEKNRRLWKNCECKPNTSLQFVCLEFLSLLLNRF